MDDNTQPIEAPKVAVSPLLAPQDAPNPVVSYDNSTPQDQVKADVAAEPAQAPAPAPKQPLSYQDQITKLQKAGFSGDEIQNYSINQAVKLRQAGFSQDEVDAYQGMKPPAVPGGTPIYGHVPTDKDFQNAASVILGGNDHPFYEKAVDTLKNLFTSTGVSPSDAVKVANAVPSFQEIMENGGETPTWGDYGSRLAHDAGSAVASGMQGLAAIKAYVNPNDPGEPASEQGTNPETTQMYQKGAAFQQWINEKLPENQKLNDANPIKMGIAGGIGSLIPLLATGGVGMAATGAGSSYQESKQAGANPEKASAQATKMGAVWGVLGVADVGMFLKPIQRSAPGVIPWITAKATQAVRSGLTFAGTNELGEWLSSEIGQASDIPLQYKPTVQRIVVNALTGAVAGAVAPTSLKSKETVKPAEEIQPAGAEQPLPPEPPSGAALAAKFTPAYHFDTDSYGIKNDKGEFVQTGLGSEEEAAHAANELAKPVAEEKQPIAPEVVDRYKKTISDEAEKQGFALTPEQLDQAARVMAESHNPLEAEKPRSLAEVQGKTPTKPAETESPEVTQAKANIEYYQKALKELDTELMKHQATDNDAGIDKTLDAINQHKKWIEQEKEIIEKNKPKTEGQQSLVISTAEKPVAQEKPQTPVENAPKPIEKSAAIAPKSETFPELQKALKGAKSGYKTATPQFASDVDKALYVVREKSSGKSKSHDKYIDYLKNTIGLSDGEIRKGSEDVLNAVKANAEGKSGNVDIPSTFKRTGAELTPEDIAANKKMQEHINRSEAAKNKKMGAPENILQSIAQAGGMKDEGGYLKSRDMRGVMTNRGRLYQKNGMSYDEALTHARDWITNKEYDTNNPETLTHDDLFDALEKEHMGKNDHVSDYEEDLNRHAEEMGIDTTGMKPEEVHAALEARTKEFALERNFVEEVKSDEAAQDYYPDMEEHYDEGTFEGAHTGREPEISAGDERPEPEAGNTRGGEGSQPINAGVTGRGAEGTGADTGRAGTNFEPAKNVAGGGEQGVLGGMEQSAKQAMAARGEKIGAKVEQKPANEGLFGEKEEDRGEFAFQKGGLNKGILSAKREEFPGFDKLMELVDRIAPGASLRIQHLIDGGDAHGSYNYAENLITLARTSPDVWHTLPHETFHAIEHLLTPEERTVLLKEAVDKGIYEKHQIAENYSPGEHDKEALAHLFGDYASDKIRNPSPEAKTVMDKIKDILSTIGAKVREVFGNETAKDILNKVFAGEVGKRTGEGQSDGLALHKDKEKVTLGDALRGIRDTFSPTSAGGGAKAMEVVLRESYGQAKRDQAIAETALNEFARQANEMTPAEHEDFYNYVEGRSAGAQLKNKQFQRMADAIRNIYANYKDALQKMPETRMMNFVQDYFTHQWAKGQDEKIKEFMNNWWQQGSSRNLKERKIPTIADGLAYGLQLEEPNPVRAVSRYVGSMSHYMASVNVLRAINTELGGGFYADGRQPEGYAPLVGRNAERIENARVDEESGKLVPARNLHLYAPREVADLYNAFYSKGFEDTKLGSAYMMVRNAINTNTMLELGLSAYHFSTINVQSFNQDTARILGNIRAGDWTGVGQAIKGLVTPGLHFIQGSKLMEQYKDLKDHGIDMERIANLFASANMRLGQDPLRNISNHGGFYKSWQRGELPGMIDRLKQQATEGYGLGLLKSGAEVVGKVVSDVSHPLFNVYVPAIKMSAFHDLMGDWMRQNPSASDGETSVNALRIGNMVEDRFGEMNMENIFWNQKAKQLLGLTFRAPGWDIGLVRQVGGAGKDIYQMLSDAASGKKFNSANLDRPLFMVASIMNYVAMNAAMTYVKTGIMPSDQKMRDWIAYATGGVHKAFGRHPEQAELPGHGRELIQLAPEPGQGPLSGVTQEISNKVATLPKKIYEAANNRDWNGRPIYDPKANSWMQRTPGVAQFTHVAGGFEPFSMEQLFEGQQPGSKLSFAERFMGVRAAGAKITAPEELKEFNEKHH